MNVLNKQKEKLNYINDNITKLSKYRFEYKYYITQQEKELLQKRIGMLLNVDKNAQENNYYSIRSIYFDDYKDTSLNQVINGISEREKYRIRFYNLDDSYICLEKKQKVNNMTNKQSCRITKEQLLDILKGENLVIKKENHKLLNEFYLKILTQTYKPVCIIEYDRVPYTYVAGNVRLTLDYNMSVSCDFEDVFSDKLNKIPFVENNMALLEVKFNDFIPDYIRWSLQLNNLTRISYSKYALGRLMLKKFI